MGTNTIRLGHEFPRAISDALNRAGVIVAAIGAGWAGSGPTGQRRLDDSDDYVRREIETGLRRDIRVIPVLIRRRHAAAKQFTSRPPAGSAK